MKAKFTSFATYQDLVGYIKCRDAGNGQNFCFNRGDNGVGASGTTTATQRVAMVALPSAELKKKWGTTKKAWGKKALLKVNGREAIAEVQDIAPAGVCDLNPGALLACGYEHDTELSVQGEWEWVD